MECNSCLILLHQTNQASCRRSTSPNWRHFVLAKTHHRYPVTQHSGGYAVQTWLRLIQTTVLQLSACYLRYTAFLTSARLDPVSHPPKQNTRIRFDLHYLLSVSNLSRTFWWVLGFTCCRRRNWERQKVFPAESIGQDVWCRGRFRSRKSRQWWRCNQNVGATYPSSQHGTVTILLFHYWLLTAIEWRICFWVWGQIRVFEGKLKDNKKKVL